MKISVRAVEPRDDELWRDVVALVRKHEEATPEQIGAAFARAIHAIGFWEGVAKAGGTSAPCMARTKATRAGRRVNTKAAPANVEGPGGFEPPT